VFVVADGMGGHQAGEVASQLAIETVRTFLETSRADSDLTWPYGFNPEVSYNANRLLTAVRLANRRIFHAGEEQPQHAGMGTTIVAGIIEQGHLAFCSVGDSRLYLFGADGSLAQLSHDDSWVATVLAHEPGMDEAPRAAPDAARAHERRRGARRDGGRSRRAHARRRRPAAAVQ
jgi:PPM family protein phosphatase